MLSGPWGGRIAVVSGAGSGIGLAIATALCGHGASVVANYARSHEGLEKLGAEFPDQVIPVQGDIGEEDTARRLAEAARERGGPHAVVHNAGVTRDALLVQLTPEEWDEAMRVNLRGSFLLTKHTVRAMMRHRQGGRQVYVSSVSAVHGMAGQAAYAASKSGLDGLAYTVAQEYERYGVQACVLAVGLVDGGLGARLPADLFARRAAASLVDPATPAEVAELVAFLASPAARTVNATTVHAFGGARA
jgi:3-oxoacyl-[acyl-carrier protein] reductase